MPTHLKERRPRDSPPDWFHPTEIRPSGYVLSLTSPMCSLLHCSRLNGYLNPKATASMALACVVFASLSCGGGGALGGMSTGSAGIAADRQFDGDTGTAAYKDHPDMAIGANGTQVVESAGQNINVYNYSGAVLTSSSISAFIRNATGTVGTVNDPRIVYDPFISRWLFVCSCSANYLIVSASSDASGGWKGLPLSGDSGIYPWLLALTRMGCT
jgi:hypothetical protein